MARRGRKLNSEKEFKDPKSYNFYGGYSELSYAKGKRVLFTKEPSQLTLDNFALMP